MSCEQIVGVKNILLTFTHCDTGQVVARRAHKLSSDEPAGTSIRRARR